jgi:hypothetical protein
MAAEAAEEEELLLSTPLNTFMSPTEPYMTTMFSLATDRLML